MSDHWSDIFGNKKIAILGFGKEGQSSYRFLRGHFKELPIHIADGNENAISICNEFDDSLLTCTCGEGYLDNIDSFDLIIRSPGINQRLLSEIDSAKLSSQAELFIGTYREQIVGITGTKGKSTTSSLLHHVLKEELEHVILVGNIGIPPFDLINSIREDTVIVYELSSYQLDQINVAPSKSILLNLYQEHVDYHGSFKAYQLAKINIYEKQNNGDVFVHNADDQLINEYLRSHVHDREYLTFGKSGRMKIVETGIVDGMKNESVLLDLNKVSLKLKGAHNLYNVAAVACICQHLLKDNKWVKHLETFKGLEHRLEFVGEINGKIFYNDSISTIPETCIQGVKALGKVDTLILGGHDRGIDYDQLIEFLKTSDISNVFFTGEAGNRMFEPLKECSSINAKFIDDFEELVVAAIQCTSDKGICLLSPAASSYGRFKNFEQRGRFFKEIVIRSLDSWTE